MEISKRLGGNRHTITRICNQEGQDIENIQDTTNEIKWRHKKEFKLSVSLSKNQTVAETWLEKQTPI